MGFIHFKEFSSLKFIKLQKLNLKYIPFKNVILYDFGSPSIPSLLDIINNKLSFVHLSSPNSNFFSSISNMPANLTFYLFTERQKMTWPLTPHSQTNHVFADEAAVPTQSRERMQTPTRMKYFASLPPNTRKSQPMTVQAKQIKKHQRQFKHKILLPQKIASNKNLLILNHMDLIAILGQKAVVYNQPRDETVRVVQMLVKPPVI